MTEETTENTTEEAAGEQPNKLAGGYVLIIGCGIAGCVVYAVPEVGYTVAGLLATTAVNRARGWVAKRRENSAQDADDTDRVDIVGALHELSPAGSANVRLTQLVEATGLPDTKPIRALLDDAGIPIKEVRTGGKVGQGVHASAIPRSCGAPPGSCWCAVTSNNNTNNTPGEGGEKGLRVERTDYGATYYDLSETSTRHHAIKK